MSLSAMAQNVILGNLWNWDVAKVSHKSSSLPLPNSMWKKTNPIQNFLCSCGTAETYVSSGSKDLLKVNDFPWAGREYLV
jgi:hypothetical protein